MYRKRLEEIAQTLIFSFILFQKCSAVNNSFKIREKGKKKRKEDLSSGQAQKKISESSK